MLTKTPVYPKCADVYIYMFLCIASYCIVIEILILFIGIFNFHLLLGRTGLEMKCGNCGQSTRIYERIFEFSCTEQLQKIQFFNSEIEAGKGGKFPSFPPKMPWPVFNFLFDLVSGGEAAGRERNPGRGGGEGQTPS